MTMRPSEICNGPKCGLIENKWTSFRAEKIFAPANKPSAINCGSKSCQCSRAMYAIFGSFRISADCWIYATPLNQIETTIEQKMEFPFFLADKFTSAGPPSSTMNFSRNQWNSTYCADNCAFLRDKFPSFLPKWSRPRTTRQAFPAASDHCRADVGVALPDSSSYFPFQTWGSRALRLVATPISISLPNGC